MKSDSLTLKSDEYPELASLHPGQEAKLCIEVSVRMKHLENTEEYVELNVNSVEVMEKEKMSVQDILMASMMKNPGQQTVV